MLTASIIHGFQKVISEKLSSFEGQGRIQHILGNQIDLTNPTLDSLIQSYSKSFSPFVRGVCMVRSGSHADGVLIEGIKLLPKAISDYPNNKIKPGEIGAKDRTRRYSFSPSIFIGTIFTIPQKNKTCYGERNFSFRAPGI